MKQSSNVARCPTMLFLLVPVLLACNPYNPQLENVACGADDECPTGLSCDPSDRICRVSPGGGSDAGAGPVSDAGPCTEDVLVSVTVNGQALVADGATPLFTVAPGDSVALSAAGSCVSQGTIEYSWTIVSTGAGFDLAGTADTSVRSETLSVYAERAGTYEVRLTVSDGDVDVKTLSAVAFEVPSWTAVNTFPAPGNGMPEFRDVSIGDGFLWVAAKEGAFRVPLDDPVDGTIFEVNTLLTGAGNVPLPGDTKAVFYDANIQFVWFSNDAADTDLYRGNFQVTPPVGQAIDTSGVNGKIRDIAPFSPMGIVVAGAAGVYTSFGSAIFSPENTDLDARAVLSRGAELWVGSDGEEGLHELTGDSSFDIFPGDDKVRRLILVDDQLWIASDAEGIARVNPADPNDKTIYNFAGGELPSDRGRFLASEANGDIWAATNFGVARYKADRDLWLSFNLDGLEDYTDANTIAIDVSNGQRTLYVGAQGMAVLRVPVPAQ